MRDVLLSFTQALHESKPLAYCRLVETRGSTPQKAGAVMLVFPGGQQVGTLGGGCVEAEVKRRALDVLHRGVAEVAKFQLDSDYGWDDGLICGGRMHVLIEPFVDDTPVEYFVCLAQLLENGEGFTEAIAFDQAASGVPIASAFLFDAGGQFVAQLRGKADASVAERIAEELRPLSERPRPSASGGIAYLPLLSRCRLVIVGGGHVGQAVASLASELDFDVWVVDDRAEIVSENRFPSAVRRIAGSVDEVLPELEMTTDTYCLIVTRGHNHDEQALYHLAERGARYVGLIGSRRKIRMIFDDLLQEGIAQESLENVFAPVGIDIGSQTVPEIAVSICAELVSHRNRSGVVPGRPDSVACEN